MTTAMQAAMVVAAAEGRRQTMAVAGAGATRFVAKEMARGAAMQLGAEAIRWLLSQFGVDWVPDGPDPYPESEGGSCGLCWKTSASDCGNVSVKYSDGGVATIGQAKEILGWSFAISPVDGQMTTEGADVVCLGDTGNQYTLQFIHYGSGLSVTCVYLTLVHSGCPCDGLGPGGGNVTPPPVQVTEGACTFNLQFVSYIGDAAGNPLGDLMEISPVNPVTPGSALSPCTISPTIIYTPIVGEPEFIPPDGPDGTPRSIEEIVEEINNTERKIIEEINNNTDERIEEYFNERVPVIAGGTWDLQGVCEKDAEGAILDPQPTTEWTYQGGSAAVVANYQLMLMQEMLQQQLDWRHLTCSGSKPELQGDWVSTGWMSLEPSENSNRPLRKLFRYRSTGDRDVIALLGYWQDFQWEAGPVCVIHKGAWWGLPQVWAASEEEGKRVIRFAGVNAGIDPDTEGTWIVSTSAGGRYGRSGTMTLACYKGQYHVSARESPDWPTMQPGQIYES